MYVYVLQEGSLNRVNLFAMNGDKDNTYRLIDSMTEHIVQHIIKVQCTLLL